MLRFFLILLLLSPAPVFAAAFTSKATGNWSSGGQTTWNEVGVPANGDTATIGAGHTVTVDVNTTVGPSAAGAYSAAGNRAVTISSTGHLVVATGVNFTIRGDVSMDGTSTTDMTMNAGSTLTFDTSVGGVKYGVLIGTANSQTGATFQCNGTTGSHVTVTSIGTSVGVFSGWADGNNADGNFNCSYTDFSNLGTSGTGFGNDTINLSTNASVTWNINHSTFTNCHRIYNRTAASAANISMTFNDYISVVAGGLYNFWMVGSATATGTRIFTDNVLEAGQVVFDTSKTGWTIDRNYITNSLVNAIGTFTGITSGTNNLFYARTNAVPQTIANVGDTWTNNYIMVDDATGSGDVRGIEANLVSSTGTLTLDGSVFETSQPTESGDAAKNVSVNGGAQVFVHKNMLILPNSRGKSSGNITAHGNKFVTIQVYHSTFMLADSVSPSTNDQAPIFMGSIWTGQNGMYPVVRDNLAWAKTAMVAQGYLMFFNPSPSTRLTKIGTISGTTTTLTDSGQNFPTTAGLTLGDAGARIYLIAGTGAGDSRIISSNTATQVTVSVPFSSAPDSTTTYQIQGFDQITKSGNKSNATYNGRNGTLFDANGNNGVASTYQGFWQTDQTIGATDINLGTGTNEGTQGPKFKDSTRNFATFDSAYLGNSATAWANGVAYVVGDIRSTSLSTFYNSVTINYRCIVAHTSATATDRPGDGSAWPTKWEMVTAFRMRTAILANTQVTDASLGLTNAGYVKTMWTWVRAGFAPTNTTLHASSDNVSPSNGWIGAVQGIQGLMTIGSQKSMTLGSQKQITIGH